MDQRQNKIPEVICEMKVVQGYILPNFFAAQAIKSKVYMTIMDKYIMMENVSIDTNLSKCSYLKGNHFELKWNNIPVEKRCLTLCYDTTEFKKIIMEIQKKDGACVYIAQIRDETNEDKFDENGSSDDFAIYVGKEEDALESYKWASATRTIYQKIEVDDPGDDVEPLYIPIKKYCTLLKDLTKLKNQEILLKFHNTSKGKGIEITLGGNRANNFYKRFGVVQDETGDTSNLLRNISVKNEGAVVVKQQPKVEISVIDNVNVLPLNEYRISSNKIIHLMDIAIHNEGGVMIYYKPGFNLKIEYEFGCFGVDKTYITTNNC